MRYEQFLWLDTAGALLYALAYTVVGYIFRDFVLTITRGFYAASHVLETVLILALAGYIAYRFWLYRKPDGKVATVFDACQICGPVGFTKGPNGVICRNCAAPINGQTVGTPGGCNPIPLKADQTSDAVVIREADVASGVHIFQP